MNDFKEKLKLVMNNYISIIVIICGVLAFPISALAIKEKSAVIQLYPLIYISMMLFDSYYSRYNYILNFSITREEYFKLSEVLSLIISVLIWSMYLLAAFVLNENVGVLNAFSILIIIMFFISLGNVISVLEISRLVFILLIFGGTFGIRHAFEYIHINISYIYTNIILILLLVSFSMLGKNMIKNIDFKAKEEG